jgi:hypothetical protein
VTSTRCTVVVRPAVISIHPNAMRMKALRAIGVQLSTGQPDHDRRAEQNQDLSDTPIGVLELRAGRRPR